MIVVKLLAKRSASSPLQVKAANDKSPTIAIPLVMVVHQSRHSPSGTATVTNVQLDGAGEQAPSAPPGKTALRSPCLAGSFEGIAAAKPPLVKEITVRLPKCKSLQVEGALEPTKDNQKTRTVRRQTHSCTTIPRTVQSGSKPEAQGETCSKPVIPGKPEGDPPEFRPASDSEQSGKTHMTRTIGCTTASTKTAERREAASTQAVNRGCKVDMYEVPDDEDDTSFMMNMKTNLIPTIETAVTLPTVVKPSWVDTKAEKVPHEWLKPFGAEWTLCRIVEAKTESEVKAILKNWIHKA